MLYIENGKKFKKFNIDLVLKRLNQLFEAEEEKRQNSAIAELDSFNLN